MIVDRKFYNIQCDHCGALLDEENWWDDKDALTTTILPECNWIECEGGRHYCESCYHIDDDDNIVTKDGRKWNYDTHKEIKSHRLNYLQLSDGMTLTQFRMELIKCEAIINMMVGTLFKGMLLDDLAVGKEWFEELLTARKGTTEFDCYYTFMSHNIFRLAKNDVYERRYNRNKQ